MFFSVLSKFDIDEIRKDFPILKQKIYGKPLTYFDNGASTQKPFSVIQSMVECAETYYSNVHRGAHFLSQQSTDAYERSRAKIAKFLNLNRAVRGHCNPFFTRACFFWTTNQHN